MSSSRRCLMFQNRKVIMAYETTDHASLQTLCRNCELTTAFSRDRVLDHPEATAYFIERLKSPVEILARVSR